MASMNSNSDLVSNVDIYMQALVALDQFSGSILIAHKGDMLVSKGYSLANREHGVPNTPQTKFRLGSVTKQFTAMTILILQNQSKLQVQDPISRVLPDCPGAWERVTIHHLLNHTSGIPEHTDRLNWETTGRSPLTIQGIIDLFKDQPLDFQPGANHRYSNSGYILLGQIVEQVSGMSYEAFLKEHIFEPLGMENTGYDRNDRVLEHRAMGYDLRDDIFVNTGYLDMSIPHAAGALYSTVEDLFLWDQALYTERLIPKASLETMSMLSPFLANYGYGVVIDKKFNRRVIGHSGGIHGFLTHLARYPEEKLCFVVLSNLTSARPDKIAQTLAAMVFGEEYDVPNVRTPVQLEPGVCKSYEGEYQLALGIQVNVRTGDQRLIAEASGGGRAEFFPASETQFFRKSNDDQMTFFKDKSGDVTHLVLRQQGMEVRANRIG
jgi:CubicO group peptidase (beta-lactamase class C family)